MGPLRSALIDPVHPVRKTVADLGVYYCSRSNYGNNETTTESARNRKRSDCGGMDLIRPRGIGFAWLGFRPEMVTELYS